MAGITDQINSMQDIILGIQVRMRGMKESIKELQAGITRMKQLRQTMLRGVTDQFFPKKEAIRKQMVGFREEMNKLAFTTKGTRRKKWSSEQIAEYQRLQNSMQKYRTRLQKVQAEERQQIQQVKQKMDPAIKRSQGTLLEKNKALRGYQLELDNTKSKQTQLKNELTRTQRQFAGWALSIMFFGMALQRAFNTIWKSSTKTFNEVMHSVEGATTQFDTMDGSLKFLQFTVGAALEPLVGMIIPIVDAVSEWVQQNEALTRVVVGSLGVGGTILTAVGMGKLAFDGLATAIGKAKVSAGLLKTTNWASIGTSISKGIGTIQIAAGVIDLAKTISDVDSGILDVVQSVVKTASGLLIVSGNPYAIGVGVMLMLLSTDTVWDKIMAFFEKVGSVVIEWSSTIGEFIASAFSGDIIDKAFAANKLAKILGQKGFDFSNFRSETLMSVAPEPMTYIGSREPMSVDNSTNTYNITVNTSNTNETEELMSVLERYK